MKPTRPSIFKKSSEEGFTLVELLVVLATVAILAALLLPAIAGTKPSSQAFQCMENQHQLMLGCQMYAADNTDLLPPNDYPYLTTYATAGAAAQATMKNWVVGTMAKGADAGDQPLAAGKVSELLDPNSVLSPYIKNRAVYHCPADNYVDPYAGNSIHVRSYSMNSAVGTIFNSSIEMGGNSGLHIGSPVSGGWLPGSSYNGNQSTWLTYGKMSSFTRPNPSQCWVFIDENPRTINDGSMAISAVATTGNTYFIDYPAGLHGGAGTMAFADGHSAVHKWKDSRTYTVTIGGQGNVVQASSKQTPDNQDCFYLAPLTSALR